MPGKIKVKILAGRNLPVMDRSGDTTDAYVEIKFGNITYKTDVCRKSLNPQWNSDWYRFEVDDAELQDEPLQLRLMDHDTYSANDAIGKVYLNLNPLLLPGLPPPVKNIWTLEASLNSSAGAQGGSVMTGWVPVFDTMHGIRGEVNIIVKVELFSDFNKFRQSSCGVQFYYSPNGPHGYHIQIIHGFVEELIVSDDPEYKWIDKIRTPRASNEARQTLFFKLSGEVQRKIGLKALDLGGNAVIGYCQNFDLEGESGIVARGIGTAVTLIKLQDIASQLADTLNIDDLSFFRSQSKNQLDCSESDDGLPLLSRSPSPYSRSPTKLHSPKLGNNFPRYERNKNANTMMKINDYKTTTMRRQWSLQSSPVGNLRKSGAISTQSLSDDLISEASLRTMLALEDMRGERTSAFSRGLKNLRYFPRKMIQIKSKLSDSVDEESDDSIYSSTWSVTGSDSTRSSFSDFRQSIRRKKFTHKRNQPDGMAALLIRSVHAGFPLDSVLEDRETPTPSPVNFREKFDLGDPLQNQPDCGVSIEEIQETIAEEEDEKLKDCVAEKNDEFRYSKGHIPMISSSETDTSTSDDEDDDEPSESSTNYNILEDSFSIGFNSSVEKSDNNFIKSADNIDRPNLHIKAHSQNSEDKNSSTPIDIEEKRNVFERALEKAKQNSFPEGMILDYEFASENILTPLLSSVSSSSDNDLQIADYQGLDSPTLLKTSSSFKLKLVGKQRSFDTSDDSHVFFGNVVPEVKGEQVTSSLNEESSCSRNNEGLATNSKSPEASLNDETSNLQQPEATTTFSDVSEVPLIDLNIESPPAIKFHPEVVGVIRKQKSPSTLPIKQDLIKTKEFSQTTEKTEISKFPLLKENNSSKIVDNSIIDESIAPYKKYLFHSGSLEGKSRHEKKDKTSKKVSRTETVIYKGPPKDKPKNQTSVDQPDIVKKETMPLPLLPKPETVIDPAVVDDSHLKLPSPLPKDISITTPYVTPNNPLEFSLPQKYTIEAQLMSERFAKKYRQHCMLDLIRTIDVKMMVHHMHNERKDSTKSKKKHGHKHGNLTPSPESVHRTKAHRRNSKSPERRHHHHHSHHNHQISPHCSGHSSHSIHTPAPTPQLSRKMPKSSQSSAENLSKYNLNLSDVACSKEKLMPSAIIIENYDKAHEVAANELMLKPINDDISSETIPLSIIQTDTLNNSQSLSPEIDTSVHKSRSEGSLDELPSNLAIINATNIPKITDDVCVPCPSLTPRQQEESSSPVHPQVFPGPVGSKISSAPATRLPVPLHRRSSDSDLSITPKGNSLAGSDRSMGGHLRPSTAIVRTMNQDALEMLEYPFITMQQFPPGFILNIGGLVSARSVKLIERISNLEEPEGRDAWWTEIRMEVRSHARALGCNVVLGYKEEISICDDVCVLNAFGTAAVINLQKTNQDQDVALNKTSASIANSTTESDKEKNSQKIGKTDKSEEPSIFAPCQSAKAKRVSESNDHEASYTFLQHSCSLCHLPYKESSVPFRIFISKCAVCKRAKVPDVLFTTIELPDNIPITGRGVLLQATVCKNKRDLRSELNAKEISDCLPFLEYELHSLLLNKLKVKGMNAVFGLRVQISIGEKLVIGMGVGTAVFLTALPEPKIPQIAADNSWGDEDELAEIQKNLIDSIKKNREYYKLKLLNDGENCRASDTDESDDDLSDLDLVGTKDAWVLEVDDVEDMDRINLLMDDRIPNDFHVVNTETIPGLEDLEIVRNLQMFTQISRAKIPAAQFTTMPCKYLARLLQTVLFKLRRMVPCALCDMQFKVALPEPDEIQLTVVGMALGLGEPTKMSKYKKKNVNSSSSRDQLKKTDDNDMIFSLDEDHTEGDGYGGDISQPSSSIFTSPLTNVMQKVKPKSPFRNRCHQNKYKHVPLKERYGVDITPLSYLPGGRIERYLGNLNFFFIRESTSIRENGGLSGFTHSFVTEILAIVRAHITALGGNAMVAFFMRQCVLQHSPHKNQGQCLINVGGDVVSVSYFGDERYNQNC